MPDTLASDYSRLLEKNKELAILRSAESIMGWDMETMMPPRAIGLRSQQLSVLSVIEHKMSTSPEIGARIHKQD